MYVTGAEAIVSLVAATLGAHRRDYPLAEEAIDSMTSCLPGTLGMTAAEALAFERHVRSYYRRVPGEGR